MCWFEIYLQDNSLLVRSQTLSFFSLAMRPTFDVFFRLQATNLEVEITNSMPNQPNTRMRLISHMMKFSSLYPSLFDRFVSSLF